MAVLQERAANKWALFHPGDATLEDAGPDYEAELEKARETRIELRREYERERGHTIPFPDGGDEDEDEAA